ncbi:hypothetical protein FRC10_011353, partial [Ceratobasidium sp. 414]
AEDQVTWPACPLDTFEQHYKQENIPQNGLDNPPEGGQEEEEEWGMVPDVVVTDEESMAVDMHIDVVSIPIPSDLQMLQ